MEFPDLGKHCSLPSCKQLDFLPVNCDACQGIFCTDHMSYEAHNCRQSHSKDRKVPVCPLCNQPISISASDSLDAKVNEHIENFCKSDLAAAKRRTYTNRCSKKGCKQREIVPVLCELCRRNYCLRHRHENDHDCTAKSSSRPGSSSRPSAASTMAGHAASRRNPTTGQAKVAALRAMQSSQSSSSNQRVPARGQQAAMSENEALARAIQASLSDVPQTHPTQTAAPQGNRSQEEEDRILAEVLAQSERDERERQLRQQQQQQRQSQSSCAMS